MGPEGPTNNEHTPPFRAGCVLEWFTVPTMPDWWTRLLLRASGRAAEQHVAEGAYARGTDSYDLEPVWTT